jgi:hypothetical protein
VTAQPKSIHTLKVTLRGVKPPVWRRIVVDSQIRVSALADVLEAAMGWVGGHLHLFDVDGVTYGEPDPEWDDDVIDERKARLADVLPKVTSRMRWDYDFGDGWEHDVVVEEIGPVQASETYPLCVTGRRACPPEDCGGPWGYRDLLEALADPSHEDHDHLSEWAPPGFDPQRFDAEETTDAMRAAQPLNGW